MACICPLDKIQNSGPKTEQEKLGQEIKASNGKARE